MPGTVSDSYDPVWGTGENAAAVREALNEVRQKIAGLIKAPPAYILDVIRGHDGKQSAAVFSERELRILRYAIGVALDEEDI